MIENYIDWKPSDNQFPMTRMKKGHGFTGLESIFIWCMIGFFTFVLFSAGIIFLLLRSYGIGLGSLILALPFIVFTVNQFLSFEKVVITKERIDYFRSDIRGKKQWGESIKNYKGVRKEIKSGCGALQSSIPPTSVYIILIHPRRDRNINLLMWWPMKDQGMTKERSYAVESKLKQYSDIFQLPILDPILIR